MTPRPKRPRGLTMLIDAASLMYRAYFAVPDAVRGPDGTPVNAVVGFLNMLARLIDGHRPRRLACAWDDDWRPQWRVDLIASYKTHRVGVADEEEDQFTEVQVPLIAEILDLAGVAIVGAERCEAEDVIGALVARARRGCDRLRRPRPLPARAGPRRVRAVSETRRDRALAGHRA